MRDRRELLLSFRHLLAIAALLVTLPGAGYAQGGPPAMPVTVATPISQRVTQWDEFSGRFEAVASVEVHARVSGFIDKIHFRDGQIVNVGDPLFTIDKRPFEIAVESAEAEVARNKAQVDLAVLQVDRGASLIKSKTITDADYDQRKANLDVARAQLNGRTEISEGMLNAVEVAIRAYDPCLSCATHAIGAMPLEVSLRNADDELLAVRRA